MRDWVGRKRMRLERRKMVGLVSGKSRECCLWKFLQSQLRGEACIPESKQVNEFLSKTRIDLSALLSINPHIRFQFKDLGIESS